MQLTPSGEVLRRRIRSLHPLLLLVTHEEQRGIGLVSSVVRDHSEEINSVMVWTLGVGWEEVWNRNPRRALETIELRELNPNRAFDKMRVPRSSEEGTLYILKDFTQFLNGPQNYVTTRMLRDTIALFRDVGDHEGPAIIVMLDSQSEIPDRLEKLVHVLDLELPDREHLRTEFSPLIAERVRDDRLAQLPGAAPDPDGSHTVDALVESCLGLTLTEAESAIGMSLAATDGIDPQIIINEKRGIIKKSGVLEFFDATTSLNDVGGLSNLKAWLEVRKQAFTQDAREFGLPAPRGMLVLGPPGCLAGETRVLCRHGKRNSGRVYTLEYLHSRLRGEVGGARGARAWDLTSPLQLHSLGADGVLAYNDVIDIVEAGIKPVVTVTFDNGSVLRLTEDHPVALATGEFVPAGTLVAGTSVLSRGTGRPKGNGGRDLRARPKRVIVNLKYHPYGSAKLVEGRYAYRRVARARLVIEARMNGMTYEAYVQALQTNPSAVSELQFLDPSLEVHHMDEQPHNDDVSNLMVLSKEEHARQHGKTENFYVDYLTTANVVSVDRTGERCMTYDVQMSPAGGHNFCAEGIVVHNTGKSLTAKSIGRAWNMPVIRMDVGALFGSLVGQSEANMRKALKTASAVAPCVLFIN